MVGTGVIFALGSAVCESLTDLARKQTTGQSNAVRLDALSAAFVLHALTFMIACPVTLAVAGQAIPASPDFWVALTVSAGINAVAMWLYMAALETSDMGEVLPLVTLSPVFLLVSAPLLLGEFPSLVGVAGVVLTTAGTYALKYNRRERGIWGPFKRLWSNDGSRKMLFVALLWAVSSPFDKMAARISGPYWYTSLIDAVLAFIYLPFMFRAGRWKALREMGLGRLFPLGFANAIRAWCQFTAFTLLLVPYAIGLKRLSVVFGILLGRLVLGERETGKRLFASILMIAGSILMLLAT